MSKTDRLVAVGATFIVVYLAVLMVHGPGKTPEAFPVFNWSLFSKIPDPQMTDYSIRFTRVDGKDLDEPVFYEEATDFLPTADKPQAYQVLQQLGRAIERDQILKIAEAKGLLDEQWLQALSQADYEIVRRDYDIIDRVRCDCYTDVTVLDETSMDR